MKNGAKMKLHATLVIPCFNESKNLPALISRCVELCKLEPNLDVILVNNGSNDDTQTIFDAGFAHERISSLHVPINRGYGFGILSGLQVARGELIGWTHADLQTDPKDFLSALAEFELAADIRETFVKGRRTARPLRDEIFTASMTVFANIFLRLPLRDINAQPSLCHRDFFLTWIDPPYDFSLDLYVYAKALSQHKVVRRFSVNFGPRLAGVGHNETISAKIRYSVRSVIDIINTRRRINT